MAVSVSFNIKEAIKNLSNYRVINLIMAKVKNEAIVL
jgi:hypothetical protein